MIDDVVVIDATVHGFNFLPSNYNADFLPELMQMLYHGATKVFSPPDPKWYVTWEQFIHMAEHYPDLLPQVLFGESQTDIAVYHGVPLFGIYKDGSSPIWIAERVREMLPGRIFIYGPIYPWRDDALEEVDRLVDEHDVVGLKFYPLDVFDNQFKPTRMSDERTMEVVARARARGLRMIGIHKAVPLGPLPLEPFQNVHDLAPLVEAFPDMVFEIVHGGIAFLPETVSLLERYPNVMINLEGTASFCIQMRQEFEQIMEAFLAVGAEDRLFFSSAALGNHPRPVIEHFWSYELPSGRLTPEVKRKILGENYARAAGWDLPTMVGSIAGDRYGLRRRLDEPWAMVRGAS